jgi:catechol 2,3-dioxygenase-like lactoylglutathione lyase family enzyme
MTMADLFARTASLPPLRISEIVLRTSRYDEMKAWYEAVLGCRAYYESVMDDATANARPGRPRRICFIRIYREHPYSEVVAIFDVPGLDAADERHAGLHHVQFRHTSLDALLDRYEAFRDAGLFPVRAADHGAGTSIYFKDPDSNVVEMSCANFASEAGYDAFTESSEFHTNPGGTAVNPDELLSGRLQRP